jgi:hypothetical protein
MRTWLDDTQKRGSAFRKELLDGGFAVDLYRTTYGNMGTGALGFDAEVGSDGWLRKITARIEQTVGNTIYGFTDDTDIQKDDHWRYRDHNDNEFWYTVTDVVVRPYGCEVELKDGR